MKKFFIEINRLRAVAVLLVLIDHFQSLVRYVVIQGKGVLDLWVGVDLFLVISGFVVASTFYKAYLANGYTISIIYKFYYRRFYRIVPAMLTVLVINFLLYYIFRVFGYVDSWALDPISRIKGAVSIITFTANIFYAQQGVLPPFDLGYFWSIALEWQFYCMFPLIIYFCVNNWRDRLITLSVIVLTIVVFRFEGWLASPLLRYDGFIIGILIFFIDYFLRNKIQISETANVIKKIYLLLLIIGCVILPNIITGPILITVIALVAGAILYLCSLDVGYLSYGKLINWILDYIGNRSYLLYLTHMTCFLIIRAFCRFFHFDIATGGIIKTLFLMAIYILVQIFVLEILARFIEKPGIKKGHMLNN